MDLLQAKKISTLVEQLEEVTETLKLFNENSKERWSIKVYSGSDPIELGKSYNQHIIELMQIEKKDLEKELAKY